MSVSTKGEMLDVCVIIAIGLAVSCGVHLVGLGFPFLARTAVPAFDAWLTGLGIGTTRGDSDGSFPVMASVVFMGAVLGIVMAGIALSDAYFRLRRRFSQESPCCGSDVSPRRR